MPAGATFAIVFQGAFLYQEIGSSDLALTLPFHLLNVGFGMALLGFGFSPWFMRYWRWFTIAISMAIMSSTSAICVASGHFEPIFVTVLITLLAGAFLPWEIKDQALLEASGVICYLVPTLVRPWHDPALLMHWLGLAAGVALAQATVLRRARNQKELGQARAALGNQVDALLESEQKFRSFFDASLDPIVITDTETGKILDVNEEFIRRTGFSRSKAQEKTTLELGLWRDAETRQKLLERLLSDGYLRDVETRQVSRSGRVVPTMVSAVSVRVGGRDCIVAVLRDITQIKKAEDELRASEHKFREIFDSSLDYIVLLSLAEGRILDVNREFTRGLGYTREEALGKTTVELGVWTQRELRRSLDREVRNHGLFRSIEVKLRAKDGRILHCLSSAVVTQISDEHYIVVFARDISHLKEAERKLKDSEATLRQIFDASTDGIALTDAETAEVLDVNRAFSELTGYAREEILGRTTRDMDFWDRPEEREHFHHRLGESGSVHNLEVDFRVKGGKRFPCLLSAVIISIRDRRCILTLARDISERREAERKLRESEETLRRIFNSSLDPMVINDMSDGTYVEVNDAFLNIIGLPREQAIGKTFRDIGVWPNPDEWKEYDRRLRQDGKVRNLEASFHVFGRATMVPALISGVVVEIGGRPCCLSIVRDISVLKDAERKLRESSAMLRKTFDSVLDPMSVVEAATGLYIDVNDEMLRVSGFSREEVIGKTNHELGIWNSLSDERMFVRQLTDKGEVRNLELTLRTRDGTTIPTLVSAVALKLGGRRCVLSIARDISGLKNAERRLRESEAMLREIFQSSIDNISLVEMSTGKIVETNDEFERTLGYSKEELVGKRIQELGLVADGKAVVRLFKALDKQNVVRNMELPFRTRSGRVVPTLVSANVLEVSGQRCALSIARDITELKETQRQLEAAREAALAASKAKSEFLSSMSHEIRTPMNAILGMADLLWETDLDREQRRYLDTVIGNGNALLDLINSILDLARVESGRLSLEAVQFDVAELTEKVAETLAIRAHEKGVELVVRLAPDLPSAVVGDPLRLRQVLTNLVGNAIKFTEKGEVEVCVERDPAGSCSAALRFSIRDTGIGIPVDKFASIFSPFTQADSSTTRRFGGSGLGLTIVDRLVHLMGGRINVESTPGRGSVFQFTAQFVGSFVNGGTEHSLPDLGSAVILVVDDHPTARAIIAETLARLGATVVEAGSAAEGLECLASARVACRPFAMVFIDCRMPTTDGIEMVQKMREAGDRTAVVMMPESVELSAKLARMRDLGVERYLVKPIKKRELCAVAAAILSHAPKVETPAYIKSPLPDLEILHEPLRILLADDSPDNRVLIRAYLKKTQCTLDEAEDGRVAVEKFKTACYHLVLMDIQMPTLDGYTAVRMIRQWERDQLRPPTPIIALTASALDDAVQRAIEAGCNLHVSKPVKKATLLASIANAIRPTTSPVDHSQPNHAGARPAPVVQVDADIGDLVPGFLERKRADASSIIEALGRGNLELVARLAHRIKGEGGSYGFEEISEIGAALENASKAGEIEDAKRFAKVLAAYLETVQVVCQQAAD